MATPTRMLRDRTRGSEEEELSAGQMLSVFLFFLLSCVPGVLHLREGHLK